VCDLCLLNPAVLVVSGLSDVLGAIGRILLSYLVHMHSSLRSLRQEQVHVGPITWEVLPQHSSLRNRSMIYAILVHVLRLNLPESDPVYDARVGVGTFLP
jgi:hypothetical protein